MARTCVDLDFILLEYDKAAPRALIEYKSEHAIAQSPTHPSYLALAQVGGRASIPVFAVRYAQNFSWWRIVSLNEVAKRMFPRRQEMTERQYVSWL